MVVAVSNTSPFHGHRNHAAQLTTCPSSRALIPRRSNCMTSGSTGAVSSEEEKLCEQLRGLDRGFAASRSDLDEVENLCRSMSLSAGPVCFEKDATMSMFEGSWRLLYTSAFSTGSLGGERPPPLPSLFTLVDIVQAISIEEGKQRLDNIVIAKLNTPFAQMDPITLTLEHALEFIPPAGARITFTQTFFGDVQVFDVFNYLPDFIKPPEESRSSTFNTMYISDNLRISIGDRRELRIYSRM